MESFFVNLKNFIFLFLQYVVIQMFMLIIE